MKSVLNWSALVSVCVAVGVLVHQSSAHQEPQHENVAPWDTPEPPLPASMMKGEVISGMPENLIQAKNFEARTPNGTTLRFLAISREGRLNSPGANLSDHSWSPDGAPFKGDYTALENHRGDGRDLARVRYLTFELDAPPAAEIDTFGFIPGSGRVGDKDEIYPGVDAPMNSQERFNMTFDRFPIVVPDFNASSYLYGIADGPWKEVVNMKFPGDGQDTKVLAKGEWGTFEAIGVKELTKKYEGFGNTTRILSRPQFVVKPTKPLRKYAYKIETTYPDTQTLYFMVPTAVKLSIRPYTYIEFKNVHFNPLVKLWPKAYWGAEGDKAIASAPHTGVRVLGSISTAIGNTPKLTGQRFWTADGYFAADGKPWMDCPFASLGRGFVYPEASSKTAPKMVVLEVERPVGATAPSLVELHDQQSGDLLMMTTVAAKVEGPFPVALPQGVDPKKVRVTVKTPRESLEKAAEIEPMRGKTRGVSPDLAELFKQGNVYSTVYRFIVRPDGTLENHLLPSDDIWKEEKATTKVVPKIGAMRVIAKLKDGKEVPVSNYQYWPDGTLMVEFDLRADGEAFNRESGVVLKDVDRFMVMLQRFETSVTLDLTMPD